MKNKPAISVIIPSLNNAPDLNRCLDSILKSRFTNYEIIFIDDGSTDNTKEVVKQYQGHKKIKIYYFSKNKGICQSRNFGARRALGKYFLFLDSDTEMNPQCLGEIYKAFEAKPKVGLIQAKLLEGKSNKINSGGHFLTLFGFPHEVGVGKNEKKYQKERLIFGARGAAIAIRKNLFNKIKGFDGDYLMCVEDTDICWRTWLTGYQIIYLPTAKVYHFQKRTSKKTAKEKFFYQGAKNNLSMIIKSAPLKILIWMLPLHAACWILIAIKFLFQKRFKEAISVFKGIFWHFLHPQRDLKRRRIAWKNFDKSSQYEKIIFGKTNFKEIILKGRRWFTNV